MTCEFRTNRLNFKIYCTYPCHNSSSLLTRLVTHSDNHELAYCKEENRRNEAKRKNTELLTVAQTHSSWSGGVTSTMYKEKVNYS